MRAAAERPTGIPWYSWAGLAAFLAVAGLIIALTWRPVVPDALRWIVTGAWAVYTIAIGIYDFIVTKGDPGAGAGLDTVPFDRWTIAHAGAGVVFGMWFLPLVWLVLIVVAWEFFEIYAPGFGEGEALVNRAVDVGVAIVGWLLVVIPSILIAGASFPLV